MCCRESTLLFLCEPFHLPDNTVLQEIQLITWSICCIHRQPSGPLLPFHVGVGLGSASGNRIGLQHPYICACESGSCCRVKWLVPIRCRQGLMACMQRRSFCRLIMKAHLKLQLVNLPHLLHGRCEHSKPMLHSLRSDHHQRALWILPGGPTNGFLGVKATPADGGSSRVAFLLQHH